MDTLVWPLTPDGMIQFGVLIGCTVKLVDKLCKVLRLGRETKGCGTVFGSS